MKKIFSIIALALSLHSTAQNLAQQVPPGAKIVAVINTPAIFEEISVAAFDSSWLGQQLFDHFPPPTRSAHKSIHQYGIDLTQPAYFFFQETDSMYYRGLYLPVSDAAGFRNLMEHIGAAKLPSPDNNTLLYGAPDSTAFYVCNETRALVIAPGMKTDYFYDSAIQVRYGLDHYGSYLDDTLPDTTTSLITPEDTDTPPVKKRKKKAAKRPSRKSTGKSKTKAKHTAYYPNGSDDDKNPSPADTNLIYDHVVTSEDTDLMTVDTADATVNESNEDYWTRKETNDSILANRTYEWGKEYALSLFEHGSFGTASSTATQSFVKHADAHDLIYIWIDSAWAHPDSGHPYPFGMPRPWWWLNNLGGLARSYYNGIYSHMTSTEHQLKWTTRYEENEKIAEACRNIYNAPLNPELLQYVNSESLLGALSFSFSTEQYLNYFPDFLTPYYRYWGIKDSDTDAVSLVKDIISLIVDEKAIDKTFRGNGLFLVNDLRQRMQRYTDYEYDDDYNAIPVTKTKYQMLPDFLLMYSTADPTLYNKALEMSARHKWIRNNNGIYSYSLDTANPEGLYTIYALIRDGIVFIGTNIADFQQIKAGTFKGNLSKEHKKLFTENNYSFYAAPSKLFNRLKPNSFSSLKSYEHTNLLLKNTGNITFASRQVPGDAFEFNIQLDQSALGNTPLDYLVKLMTQLNYAEDQEENH